MTLLLLIGCGPSIDGGTGGGGGGVALGGGSGGGSGGAAGGGLGGGSAGGGGGAAAGPDFEWTQWPAPPDTPLASNYQVSGGIVTDVVTGLRWQQDVSTSRYTHAAALTLCDGLSLGGVRWRLPTIVELGSIAGLERVNPAIEPTVFPGTMAEPFWSSTAATQLPTHAWVVDFMAGVTTAKDKSLDERVRCVACAALNCVVPTTGGTPQGRYTVSADTVLDTTTALTWQRNPPTATVTRMNAGSACQTLNLGGTGWRLPTVKELQSLMNVRAVGVAIDAVAFPSTQSGAFWTSLAESATWVWVVDSTGGTRSMPASNSGYFRCVRR